MTDPEPTQTRSAIVGDLDASIELKAGGLRATTFDGLALLPDWATRRYLGGETAVLWATPSNGRKVKAAANRLQRLGVAIRVYRVPQR